MNKKQDNLEYVKGYGKNYADLRKKEYNHVKDYTVRELADELFISASTISKIENEKVYPTVEQVKSYKKFFHVSLDYLTGETKAKQSDIQMICEYTGLSEKSVTLLRLLNLYSMQEDDHEIVVIDKIISYFDYHDLIIHSIKYLLNLDLSEKSDEYINDFAKLFPEANKWLSGKGIVVSNERELYNVIESVKERLGEMLLDIVYNENPSFTKNDRYISLISEHMHKSSYIDFLNDNLE